MKQTLFIIIILLGITGCTREQNHSNPTIVYMVYKQGFILGSNPIYYVKDNLPEVWRKPLAGILGDHPQWSSDGKWITFITARYAKINWRNTSSIFVMSADGWKRYKVHQAEGYNPTWQPGGTKLAYDTGFEIWTVDVGCYMEGKATCQPQPTFIAEGTYPDWSPGGEKIVFKTKEQQLAVLSLQDSQIRMIDLTPGIEAYSPSWSPDGERIAFSAYDPVRKARDIMLFNFELGEVANLTRGIGFNTRPKWTSDGENIVFISKRDGLGEIIGYDDTIRSDALFIMNAEGGDLKRIGSHQDEMVLWFSILP